MFTIIRCHWLIKETWKKFCTFSFPFFVPQRDTRGKKEKKKHGVAVKSLYSGVFLMKALTRIDSSRTQRRSIPQATRIISRSFGYYFVFTRNDFKELVVFYSCTLLFQGQLGFQSGFSNCHFMYVHAFLCLCAWLTHTWPLF